MEKKKPEIDIVNEILEACIMAYPVSSFVISLYKQYLQRGSLSKKQLQGLYGKASKIEDLPAGRLATLEALIARMPTRLKSAVPPVDANPTPGPDPVLAALLDDILAKAPAHKRVLFLRNKFQSNEPLSSTDRADLQRFAKALGVR